MSYHPGDLRPFPVIHHFYPIDPHTASQQQEAVYNAPHYPLVAPIVPVTVATHTSRDPRPKTSRKRKLREDDDSEVQFSFNGNPSERRSQPSRQSKMRRTYWNEQPMTSIIRRTPGLVAFVEIPYRNSIDLKLYQPITSSSLNHFSFASNKGHKSISSALIEEMITSPSVPTLSSPERTGGYTTHDTVKQRRSEGKSSITDGSTCHQCRRKTPQEKMHCRKVRLDGTVCPLLFCHGCIKVRYDEVFDSLHPSWQCPRCRGICNCSLCLRKAGFGYILDGPMSVEFTGTQGRLSGRNARSQSRKGKIVDDPNERPSVREWLARKGIALGNEEWLEERRRQGVRFVVGKSPPPLDMLSPYKEASSNAYLAACAETIEEEEGREAGARDIGFPLDPRLINEGSSALRSPSRSVVVNASGLPSPVIERGPDPDEDQHTSGVNPHNRNIFSPHNHASSVPSYSNEDLPGLSRALTRDVRLVIGKSLRGLKKQTQAPMYKLTKSKVHKVRKSKKKPVEDVKPDQTKLTIKLMRRPGRPPGIKVLLSPTQSPDVEEEKDFIDDPVDSAKEKFVGGASSHIYRDGSPLTPPPPHPPVEPMLVPTQHYMPSKLDATLVKDPQAEFGSSYWTFGGLTPRGSEYGYEQDGEPTHGPTSSITVSPARPPDTGSAFASASTNMAAVHSSPSISKQQIPHEFLISPFHQPTRDDYVGLNPFEALDDHWATVDMVPSTHLEMDVPPLQMESVARAVTASLRKH